MDFTTLAFNPLSRMNEVYRYSSVYQETRETLAEHITEVSTMSYLIAKYLNEVCGEKIDIGVLLEKCLLHDMDEVLTGDIPRNTKYATAEVHNELNRVADEAVVMIESLLGEISIKDAWTDAKKGKEGLILKVVDMLVVVKKSMTEIELRGNLSFLKVITELETHLENMINSGYVYEAFPGNQSSGFLMNLISQAKDEVTTIRVRNQHIIDKYSIKENVIRGA